MNHFDLWGGPEDAQTHNPPEPALCDICGELCADDGWSTRCAECKAYIDAQITDATAASVHAETLGEGLALILGMAEDHAR